MAMDPAVSSMNLGTRIRLAGLVETGGEILEYSSPDRTVSSRLPRGTLRGVVWDSTRHQPLPNANVFLNGTSFSTRADETGEFVLSDLPDGVFSATFTHPRLDSLGWFHPGTEVAISAGEPSEINLSIPADRAQPRSVCNPEDLEGGMTALVGVVRGERSRKTLSGVTVAASWSVFETPGGRQVRERRLQARTVSDGRGRYVLCGLPLDTPLLLQASYRGQTGQSVSLQCQENTITVADLVAPEGGSSFLP